MEDNSKKHDELFRQFRENVEKVSNCAPSSIQLHLTVSFFQMKKSITDADSNQPQKEYYSPDFFQQRVIDCLGGIEYFSQSDLKNAYQEIYRDTDSDDEVEEILTMLKKEKAEKEEKSE